MFTVNGLDNVVWERGIVRGIGANGSEQQADCFLTPRSVKAKLRNGKAPDPKRRLERRKFVIPLLVLLLTGSCFADDLEDVYQELSPDESLLAAARRIPDPTFVWRAGNDGTRVVVVRSDLVGKPLIAAHDFPTLTVEKIAWSPDGKFLAFSMTNSGGHSPWHVKMFVCSIAERSFRDVDEATGGQVASGDFTISAPDKISFTIERSASSSTDEPKKVELSLFQAFKRMKLLK